MFQQQPDKPELIVGTKSVALVVIERKQNLNDEHHQRKLLGRLL